MCFCISYDVLNSEHSLYDNMYSRNTYKLSWPTKILYIYLRDISKTTSRWVHRQFTVNAYDLLYVNFWIWCSVYVLSLERTVGKMVFAMFYYVQFSAKIDSYKKIYVLVDVIPQYCIKFKCNMYVRYSYISLLKIDEVVHLMSKHYVIYFIIL